MDLGKSFGIGFAAGLRSVTPLAVLAWHPDGLGNGKISRLLKQPAAGPFLTAGLVGEDIADKLPFVGSRLIPPSLIGRSVTGAIVGSVVAEKDQQQVLGAALGVIGALVGSFAGYFVRNVLTTKVGLPAVPVALAEDVAAVLLSERMVR